MTSFKKFRWRRPAMIFIDFFRRCLMLSGMGENPPLINNTFTPNLALYILMPTTFQVHTSAMSPISVLHSSAILMHFGVNVWHVRAGFMNVFVAHLKTAPSFSLPRRTSTSFHEQWVRTNIHIVMGISLSHHSAMRR